MLRSMATITRYIGDGFQGSKSLLRCKALARAVPQWGMTYSQFTN